MFFLALKFSFHVKKTIMDAMVEIQDLLINGFTKTTSLIKLVHLIKHMDMIMDWDAQPKSNAKTVFQQKDVGLKNEQKFTQLKNMEQLVASNK